MAGRLIEVSTELTEVALVASTIKTVVEVTAPTNIPLKLVAWGISFDGIAVADAPAELSLARKSVAGTGTAATERDFDEDRTGTIQTVGRVNMTGEGTITYDFQPRNVHPQTGFEIWYPEGKEVRIEAGGILGIRANVGANINAHAFMLIEE
ncbi:MAG: hypothetical protein LN413_00275 [Candidatus Thermoplasmatota archaeon]|nr:hypothetical protein [Candidatus Thermoplasmatota archaeon]